MSERPRILVVENGWVLAEALCVSLPKAGFELAGPAPSVEEAGLSDFRYRARSFQRLWLSGQCGESGRQRRADRAKERHRPQ